VIAASHKTKTNYTEHNLLKLSDEQRTLELDLARKEIADLKARLSSGDSPQSNSVAFDTDSKLQELSSLVESQRSTIEEYERQLSELQRARSSSKDQMEQKEIDQIAMTAEVQTLQEEIQVIKR